MSWIRDEEELDLLFIQEELNEMTNKPLPLTYPWEVGRKIDFTTARKGRLADAQGNKVSVCPHCKRMGARLLRLDGKVRYSHVAVIGELGLQAKDACTMWERTEHRLKYGTDTIHPKFRRPGDDDMTVEEIR